MSDIFSASVADEASNIGSQLPSVLKVVLSSPPSKSDFTLSASWVQVLGGALVAFNTIDSKAAGSELGKVWKSVWNFLESTDATVRKEAAKSLASISTCFTPALIEAALADRQGSTAIRKIIAQVTKALDALTFARAIPEILATISALITSLAYKEESDAPTAAEMLLSPVILRVSELRIEKGFEHKEAADATLAVAMRVLGPAVLLELLPLNLEPESR
jgi:ribosomal RNA-processing protein 12